MIRIIKELMNNEDIKYSIYIKNIKSGEVFKENEGELVSSASVIKLFIMDYILELAEKGKIHLEDKVKISKEERVEGGIINLLSNDISYNLKDLITLMIIESDNTATNMLIDIAGMEEMNRFIHSKGYKDTVLQRKMMDFNARNMGKDNLTTARDVGQFLEKIYEGYIANKKNCKQMLEIMGYQRDSRMMRRELEEEMLISHKTGDLPGINHDVGIIFGEENDCIFVMLTWGAKDSMVGKRLIGDTAKIALEQILSRSGDYED